MSIRVHVRVYIFFNERMKTIYERFNFKGKKSSHSINASSIMQVYAQKRESQI